MMRAKELTDDEKQEAYYLQERLIKLDQAIEVAEDALREADFDAHTIPLQQRLNNLESEREMKLDRLFELEKKALKESSGQRLALLITGNAYIDRDHEIIRQKAFEAMVEGCWEGETFKESHPLLFWHRGDPIGQIIYAEMYGPFLVEVAKELPDREINIADKSDFPLLTTIKEVWDMIEENDLDWGASYEFFFKKEDAADSVYDEIMKTESSVLPRNLAANGFTYFEVLRR